MYCRRWCIDKLGIFHANQTSILGMRMVLLHVSMGNLFTNRSKAMLLLWILVVIHVSFFVFVMPFCLFLAAL